MTFSDKCIKIKFVSNILYAINAALLFDESTWEGRNTETPLGPPDSWGSQVIQNEFSCKGRQATVPGGGMPGGVSDTSGDAGALCAPARPRHRGYTGGGQPLPTTVTPLRPSGLQEGVFRAPPGDPVSAGRGRSRSKGG